MSRFSRINNNIIILLASTSTGINSKLTNSESSSNDFDDSDSDCDYIPCQTQENTDSGNENSELSYHTLQPVEQVPLINNAVYSEHVVNEPDNIDQVVYDDIPQTTNVDLLETTLQTIGNQVETPLRRWNKSNHEGSIRAINKKKRNLGLEYTVSNKKFSKKLPKPIQYDKCKFDCLSFTEEERNEICHNYRGLVDFQRKKDFIISKLLISEPNRRRPRQLNSKC